MNSLTEGEILPSLRVAVSAVDRSGKPIPAHVFAPALARASVAHDIDMWAFRETLAWMQANEETLEKYALVIVPLSGASVRNEDLPGLIMTEFMETPVPPGRIRANQLIRILSFREHRHAQHLQVGWALVESRPGATAPRGMLLPGDMPGALQATQGCLLTCSVRVQGQHEGLSMLL